MKPTHFIYMKTFQIRKNNQKIDIFLQKFEYFLLFILNPSARYRQTMRTLYSGKETFQTSIKLINRDYNQ